MLMIGALVLFAVWLVGMLILKGSFIHLVLIIAVAIFTIHLMRRRRCGEPILGWKSGEHRKHIVAND